MNGEAGDGVRLDDGARIRVGGQVALFRSPTPRGAPVAVVGGARVPRRAARPVARRPDAVGAEERRRRRRRRSRLTGALLLLFAAYQAIRYLDTKGAEPTPPIVASMFDEAPVVRSTPEEAAHEGIRAARARSTPATSTKLQEFFDGYARLAKIGARHRRGGQRAAMRLRELRPQLAAKVWKDTSHRDRGARARSGRYRSALAMLEAFEARFAGTERGARRARPLSSPSGHRRARRSTR